MSGGRVSTRLWGSGMALSLALVPDSQVNVVQSCLGHCFKVYFTPCNLLFKANALSGKSLMRRLLLEVRYSMLTFSWKLSNIGHGQYLDG